jgi:hypothetical protein
MRPNKLLSLSSLLSTALFFAPLSGAQQKPTTVPQANMAYDVSRESVVQGTVVSYTAASSVAPIGPHVKVQTASGVVDVHLGNASLIKQNDVILASGDSVSIVGESLSFGSGSVFVARVLKKGSQTITLRNLNGVPIMAKAPANAKPRSILGGAR